MKKMYDRSFYCFFLLLFFFVFYLKRTYFKIGTYKIVWARTCAWVCVCVCVLT